MNAHGLSVGIPFPRPRLTLDTHFSNDAHSLPTQYKCRVVRMNNWP